MQNYIKPGQIWLDTEGKRIQAHGAQLWHENGVYYWIGENKEHTTGESEVWSWGVRMYSSVDLCNWKDEGLIVEPNTQDRNSVLHPSRFLDRPHLLYNDKTGKYVLWLKYCDDASYAVLIADRLKGPYTIVRQGVHLYGMNCGDYDLAKDETTGRGYVYFEVNHTDVWGAKLNDDFTDVEGEHSVIYHDMKPPLTREAVTHFLRNGKHYLVTSGMTGYLPNPSEVAVSDDWLSGYTVQGNPHIGDKSNTSFHSQISSVFKVPDRDLYIAVADRWAPDQSDMVYDGKMNLSDEMRMKLMKKVLAMGIDPRKDMQRAQSMAAKLFDSAFNTSIADYVWLPIRFEDEKALIEWKAEWNIKNYHKE